LRLIKIAFFLGNIEAMAWYLFTLLSSRSYSASM